MQFCRTAHLTNEGLIVNRLQHIRGLFARAPPASTRRASGWRWSWLWGWPQWKTGRGSTDTSGTHQSQSCCLTDQSSKAKPAGSSSNALCFCSSWIWHWQIIFLIFQPQFHLFSEPVWTDFIYSSTLLKRRTNLDNVGSLGSEQLVCIKW